MIGTLLLFLAAGVCSPTPVPAARHFAFTTIESGLPRSGQWRDKFDIADMNGDGFADVVHGPARKGNFKPNIFLGDGAGRFVGWNTAHYPDLPYDYGDAKAADFDGNGLMDLALASHLRGLTVLVQEGDGHFSPWASGLDLRLPAGGVKPPFTSRAIAIVDWNRDRLPDVVALNEGPSQFGTNAAEDSLAVFLNRKGEWQRANVAAPKGIFGRSIAAGDIDADGNVDVILGTSVAGRRDLRVESGSSVPASLPALRADAFVTAVALRDRTILAATAWHDGDTSCNSVDALDGDRSTVLASDAANDPFVTLVPADFDGDGRGDLVALRMRGSMVVFRGTRDGLVRDADVAAPKPMAGCDAYDAHAADLDGDGAAEVIVTFAGDLVPSLGAQCTRGGGFVVWRVNSAP